jgi:hypothetical protein
MTVFMNADELISSTSSICTALVTRQVNIIAQRFELAYPPRVLRETIVHKRLVSSIIHKCITCRKLRGKTEQQIMADLPTDRVEPSPPCDNV